MKTKTTITFETRQLTIVQKRTKAESVRHDRLLHDRCYLETEAFYLAEAAGRLG